MRTLIAIPCGDSCPTDFLRALLGLEIVGEAQYTFAQGSLIYDARNRLAEIAMDGKFDLVLWLDSDMVFPPDTMRILSAHLDAGTDMVSAIYVTRKDPIEPVAYSDIGMRQEAGEKWPTPYRVPINPIPAEPFEVAGCGFGVVMMSVELLRQVHQQFGLPFSPAAGFGEDLSFCLRARETGATILCDPTLPIGHVGLHTYTINDLRR